MIPKKIHYCWFGRGPKSLLAEKCIESWKKYFPDYEIIEWNEDNFDINYNSYTKEAYEAKKYAFVSDVARLYIVYTYGGIYFDVDVEVIKKFDFTDTNFIGFESDKYVNTGLGFGAAKGNRTLKKLLDDYNDIHFNNNGELNLKACPVRNTEKLIELGLVLDGTKQVVDDLTVYPADYFSPKNCTTGVLTITFNTYSIHHYDGSWLPKEEYKSIISKRKYVAKYGEEEGIRRHIRKEKIINTTKRYILLPFRILKNPKKYITRVGNKNEK